MIRYSGKMRERTMKEIGTIIIFLILFPVASQGQQLRTYAEIDTNDVLIGDQVGLMLNIISDLKTEVVWPSIPDTIGNLDVISRSKIDTLDSNNTRYMSRKFVVTSFDSGRFEIPPFVFMYEQEGREGLYPAETEPLYLSFATVAVDTAKPIKDIKSPFDEPVTLDEYIWYIVGAVAIIAAVIVIIWFVKRRKPRAVEKMDYDPRIPPHVLALEGLKQLEDEKLWQKGRVKSYHIRLTDIIRTYIERRFDVMAMEMTTPEIVDGMHRANIDSNLTEDIRKVLELADMVKFAKMEPLPDENTSGMTIAVNFVKRTIPVSKPVEEKAEEKDV